MSDESPDLEKSAIGCLPIIVLGLVIFFCMNSWPFWLYSLGGGLLCYIASEIDHPISDAANKVLIPATIGLILFCIVLFILNISNGYDAKWVQSFESWFISSKSA